MYLALLLILVPGMGPDTEVSGFTEVVVNPGPNMLPSLDALPGVQTPNAEEMSAALMFPWSTKLCPATESQDS